MTKFGVLLTDGGVVFVCADIVRVEYGAIVFSAVPTPEETPPEGIGRVAPTRLIRAYAPGQWEMVWRPEDQDA